jgi:hypothetical protein
MASVEDVKLHMEANYELADDPTADLYILEFAQENQRSQLVMAHFMGPNLMISAPFGVSDDLTPKQALARAGTLIYGIGMVGEQYVLRHVMALENVSREDIDDGLTTLAACANSLKE